jgi:hypothetical protein
MNNRQNIMVHQWTGSPEILRVKPNGDFELANGVDPLVALGHLSKAFMKHQERIKRLEEAGDALANNHNPFTFIDWTKAKEDKP